MARTTILIADDSEPMRVGLQRRLERDHGLEIVAVCEDGRTALEALRELRPQVAILDQFMPHLGGIEVARAAHEENLGTAVILLSGGLDGVDNAEVLAAGIRVTHEKGISTQQLLDAVHSLGHRTARRTPAT